MKRISQQRRTQLIVSLLFAFFLGVLVAATACRNETPPTNSSTKHPGLLEQQKSGVSFIKIEPGTFMRGVAVGNMGEMPVHRVRITRGFEIGKYEVTQEQWRAVMGDNPSPKECGNCPVEMVSWDEVQGFLSRLNAENDGYDYRLPTEAEWEYACRAGTTEEYAGDIHEMAWFDANSGGTAHPVGQKKPNAWGLYDMHGNSYEWCQDWYDKDYYSNTPEDDPQGPSTGSYRVMRGGTCDMPDYYMKSGSRNYGPPMMHGLDHGFRIVRTNR